MRRRQWLWLALPAALFATAWGFSRGHTATAAADQGNEPASIAIVAPGLPNEVSLSATTPRPSAATASMQAPTPGVDLVHMALNNKMYVAPAADKRVVRLTLDPQLQGRVTAIVARYHIPEVSVVMIDPDTGRVLAYVSSQETGEKRDLIVEAKAPSASVFKVVTATALVTDAKLTADTKQCYSGGEQHLTERDLQTNEARDKYCTTLAGAMGRSINTVFARLAMNNLKPEQLEKTAKAMGYGDALPFDVPLEASSLNVPKDSLNFARTAAGFWNTTLSPMHAAWMMSTVARGGEPIRPFIVAEVVDESGKSVYRADRGPLMERAMSEATAQALIPMLENTVTDGTSFKAFHDRKGTAFLPGIPVAGKTGTLTDAEKQRYYTWFAGFAPSNPMPNVKRVAVSVLVVNGATWKVKANVIAREALHAFYTQDAPKSDGPNSNAAAAKSKHGHAKH